MCEKLNFGSIGNGTPIFVLCKKCFAACFKVPTTTSYNIGLTTQMHRALQG